MRERHATRRHDHEYAEHPLYGEEVLVLFCLGIRFDSLNCNRADYRDADSDRDCEQVGLAETQVQSNMLRPLRIVTSVIVKAARNM